MTVPALDPTTAGGPEVDAATFLQALLADQPVMYGPDPELLAETALRPRTEREDAALLAIEDPTDITVTISRLEAVLESAMAMLQQVSAAPAARWGDLVMGLYTREGDFALATSSGVNIFSATTSPVPKFISRFWADEPTVGLREGDIYYHNDANYGGTHNLDHTLLIPLFWEGEHVAWIGAVVHEGESGAAVDAGGFATRAVTPYGEGVRIPPMKIGEGYRVRRDVVNLFQNQVRDPLLWLVGVRSKLAAVRDVERRLHELMEERSPELLIATLRQVLEGTEAEVRRRIAAWPDGVYRAVHHADTTLLEERLLKLPVEVTKRGSTFTVRCPGAAPAIDRAMSAQAHFSRAIVGNFLMNFVFPDLPRTAGFVAALDVQFEPNSILSSGPENPSSLSLMTTFALHNALHQVVTKALFPNPGDSEPIAPWYAGIATLQYGGLTQHLQVAAGASTEMNAAPGGALRDRDGEHAASPFFAPVSDWGEMELRESEIPVLGLWRRIPRDNHGFGRQRGGASVEWAYMMYGSQMFAFGVTSTGGRFPMTAGLYGGYGGPCTPLTIVRPEGGAQTVLDWLATAPDERLFDAATLLDERPFPAVYEVHEPVQPADPITEGELWIQRMGGSGGYGDPLERDPAAVVEDLRQDLISDQVATEVYQVRYDPRTFEVDPAATDDARRAARAQRLARGLPYDEFVAAWRRDEPPEGIPYLGRWSWEEA